MAAPTGPRAVAAAAVEAMKSIVQATSDTGAGRHLLTTEAGKIWRPRRRHKILFETAGSSVIEGYGGEVLDVAMMDESGVWRKKSSGPAYVVPSAAHTLLSIPTTMENGLGAYYSPTGDEAWLVDAHGIRYPMRLVGGTYKIDLHILPVGNSVDDGEVVDVIGEAMSVNVQADDDDVEAAFEAAVNEAMVIMENGGEAAPAVGEPAITASATRDASKKSRVLTETNVVPRGGSPGDVSEVFEGPGKSKSGGEGDGEGDGTCVDSVSAANSISTTPIERDQAMPAYGGV